MKFKPQIIIILFLLLWIIFIGWGMVKTSIQLSKEEALLEEPTLTLQKPEISEPLVEGIMEEPEIAPVLVRTFKAMRTDFSDILPAMGTVKGETEVEIKFQIDGVIQSINFREGEKIKKGDLIASLDPKDAQLKLEYVKNKFGSAQAAYLSSLKKLEVHQKLYEAGAIIKSKLEEVELESERAKFELATVKSEEELGKNELEKTNLYATFDGVMGPRDAEEGEFVTPQDKVASLLEIKSVLVEVGIVERDINKIKLGQKAKVYVDAYPNVAFEGVIDNIFPVVEGRSRTLTVKIKVDNPEWFLLPGMFCRAEILIIELKGAFIIPSTGLVPGKGETVLIPVIPTQYIETSEDGIKTGTVQLRQAGIGYITSDYTQITKGLNDGDLVVIEAQGEIKDNSRVRITAIEEITF